MLPRLLRAILALSTCTLMGAMLGRYFAVQFLDDPGADAWGWLAGLVVGLIYAASLMTLSLGGRGTSGRAIGDMTLSALCVLALAQLGAEISHLATPWLPHAVAACYLLGFLAALAGMVSPARPQRRPDTRPPPA